MTDQQPQTVADLHSKILDSAPFWEILDPSLIKASKIALYEEGTLKIKHKFIQN